MVCHLPRFISLDNFFCTKPLLGYRQYVIDTMQLFSPRRIFDLLRCSLERSCTLGLNSAGAGRSEQPEPSPAYDLCRITHIELLGGAWERGRGRVRRVHRVHGFVRPYEYSELAFAAMKIRLPRSYGDPLTCNARGRRDERTSFSATSFPRSHVPAPAALNVAYRRVSWW